MLLQTYHITKVFHWSIMAIIKIERWCSKMKKIEQEIEFVFKNELSFEEQIQRVNKMNNHFVDIATNYHVNKIKSKKQT